MLEENFQRHYRYNRAPFVVAIDSEYLTSLQDSGAVSALEIFISKVNFLVTSNTYLICFPQMNPSTCTFTCDRGEAHAFRICGSCPRAYPKLGDPTGSGNVTAVN
uniref:Uncharacterized protein n=1 Tax=Parascaris equorum TaxID=6256 RepID=A0A914RNR9_PAREQ